MTAKNFFSFLLPLTLGCMTLTAAAQKTATPQASSEERTAKPKGPLGVFKKAETPDAGNKGAAGSGTAEPRSSKQSSVAGQSSARPLSDVKARHQEAKKEVRVAKRERKAAQAREEAARARAEALKAEKKAVGAESRSIQADKRADKARQKAGMR